MDGDHLSLPPSVPLSVTLPQRRSRATGLADAGSLIQTNKIKQLLASSGRGAMLTPCLATLDHPPPHSTRPRLPPNSPRSSQCVTAVSYTPEKEATSVILASSPRLHGDPETLMWDRDGIADRKLAGVSVKAVMEPEKKQSLLAGV